LAQKKYVQDMHLSYLVPIFFEVIVDGKVVFRKVMIDIINSYLMDCSSIVVNSSSSRNLTYNIFQCLKIENFVIVCMLIYGFFSLLPMFIMHVLLGLMDCLSHIGTPFLRFFSNAMNVKESHTSFTL
jgi:hypothetical protein